VRIFLLGQKQFNFRVVPEEIFKNSSLFEGFFFHRIYPGLLGKIMKPFRLLKLLLDLRGEGFDAVVYLPLSDKATNLMRRDRGFFKLVGIHKIIGLSESLILPPKKPGEPLSPSLHEADIFLKSLATDGLKIPPPMTGKMDLRLTAEEEREFHDILSGLPPDAARPWIGVVPGAKKPANIWPLERYQLVVKGLVQKYKIWPVVFGSEEERFLGEKLIAAVGCGYNLAGLLSVRLSAVGLRRCRLYLGNDTGAIHLAAAVGTPCVGVYSSADRPGLWYPYGKGHDVIRTAIECEGCLLMDCVEKKMECILSIKVEEVAQTCEWKLAELLKSPH
jgi:ADP-heptose:LPS heptosyltransferase